MVMQLCKYNFRSEKKALNQLNDFMKKKHHLRLIELEESVLLAQVKNLFDNIFVFFLYSINKVEK